MLTKPTSDLQKALTSIDLSVDEQERGLRRVAGLHEPRLLDRPVCCGGPMTAVDGGYGCSACLRPHGYCPPGRGPRGRYDGRIVSRFNSTIVGRIDEATRRVITDDGRTFQYGSTTGPRDAVWICWSPCPS
jgi:hypothetical protein